VGVATSRWSAPKSGSKLGEGEVYLTNTGLLMEDAEKNAENALIISEVLREFLRASAPPR